MKATIAPYKYPREIEFVASLPRTETGKLQRFRLRQSQSGLSTARAAAAGERLDNRRMPAYSFEALDAQGADPAWRAGGRHGQGRARAAARAIADSAGR